MSIYPIPSSLPKATMLVLMLFVSFLVIGSDSAQASHYSGPIGGALPADERTYLKNVCNHNNLSPALTTWVSPANAPTSKSLSVDYGTESIQLALNYYALVCYPNSAVTSSRTHVLGVSAVRPPHNAHDPNSPRSGSFSGINGQTLALNWGSDYNHVGSHRAANRSFTYAPPGGFTQSGWYMIYVRSTGINRFSSGSHLCTINNKGNVGGFNFSDCDSEERGFPIYITVRPKPVDGGNCSATVVGGSNVLPSQKIDIGFTVTNSGTNGGFVWSVQPENSQRYRLRDRTPSAWPGAPNSVNIAGDGIEGSLFGLVMRNGKTTSWTLNDVTAPDAPGTYTFDWQIYGYNKFDGNHYVGEKCPLTITVAERPYFKVYGGDVSVGAAFDNYLTPGNQCIDTGAKIAAWHQVNRGSGAQIAVYALDRIDGFASGQQRNTNEPKNLTFANDTGVYGGYWADENISCADDFWADAPEADNLPPNPISSESEVYRSSGDTIINVSDSGLGDGQSVTVFVDGDARITNNINYQDFEYSNRGSIPSFRLIVRGNIYVDASVEVLNGLFVAIPDADESNTGRFYTCNNGGFGAPSATNVVNECSNQLTVYGSVLADRMVLARSEGSIEQSTTAERFDSGGSPAEKFIYSPEVWLTSGFSKGSDTASYRSLPPTL